MRFIVLVPRAVPNEIAVLAAAPRLLAHVPELFAHEEPDKWESIIGGATV